MPKEISFVDACKCGDMNSVITIIQETSDISELEHCEQNVLHICAKSGNEDIGIYLLNHGFADTCSLDSIGWTALHYAVYHKCIKLAKLISDKNPGALRIGIGSNISASLSTDTNMKIDEYPLGTTSVHLAIICQSFELLEYFIQFNVDLFGEDSLGRSAINLAEELLDDVEPITEPILILGKKNFILHEAIKKGFEKFAVKLIDCKAANVNQVNDKNYTPLYLAVLNNQYLVAEALIQHGCQVNQKIFHTNYASRYEQGLTPMHLACQNMNFNLVELLLEAGTLVNETNAQRQMPLHLFCRNLKSTAISQNTSVETVFLICEALLLNGAEVNAVESRGYVPFQYSMESRQYVANLADLYKKRFTKVYIMLLSAGAEMPQRHRLRELNKSILETNSSYISFFLEYGLKFNNIDQIKELVIQNDERIVQDNLAFVKNYLATPTNLRTKASSVIRMHLQSGPAPNIWCGINKLGLPPMCDTRGIILDWKYVISNLN